MLSICEANTWKNYQSCLAVLMSWIASWNIFLVDMNWWFLKFQLQIYSTEQLWLLVKSTKIRFSGFKMKYKYAYKNAVTEFVCYERPSFMGLWLITLPYNANLSKLSFVLMVRLQTTSIIAAWQNLKWKYYLRCSFDVEDQSWYVHIVKLIFGKVSIHSLTP